MVLKALGESLPAYEGMIRFMKKYHGRERGGAKAYRAMLPPASRRHIAWHNCTPGSMLTTRGVIFSELPH
jgi:hypothetical protein